MSGQAVGEADRVQFRRCTVPRVILAGQFKRGGDVFLRGHGRQQVEGLQHDPDASAPRVAAARGTSVSRLVDDLLSALPDADARPVAEELTPAVKRLLGVARESALTEQDYRLHLVRKYGARE
jgi:hypothetical protein